MYANATDIGSSVLDCPDCKVIWCKFCEKQLAAGESQCTICVEGLRSVFLDIYDAIEEAAGMIFRIDHLPFVIVFAYYRVYRYHVPQL